MKYLLILVICIFILLPNKSVGQFNCPPQDSCQEPWSQGSYGHYLGQSQTIRVNSTIKYRENCEGIVEFIVVNTSVFMNAQYLENFQFEEYGVNTARDLVWLHILEFPYFPENKIAPNCSEDTIQIAHVYTASCGVWLKCSYKVDPASQVCDFGYVFPSPIYLEGTDNWVDHWKWHSCGNACCRREFRICRTYDANALRTVFKVEEVKKEKILDCEKEGQFINWKTQNPIPCNNDCF